MKTPPASASLRTDLALSTFIGGVMLLTGFLLLAGWMLGSEALGKLQDLHMPGVPQPGTLTAWAFTVVPIGLLLSSLFIGSSVLQLYAELASHRQGASLRTWETRALNLITSQAPLPEILDSLMFSLEKQLPETLVSVLLLDEDGLQLRHTARSSLPEAYDRAIAGITIGPAVGSCATVLDRDLRILVSNIASDPRWTTYRELAREHSLHASWSTPIHGRHREILGSMVIHYQQPRRPALAELEVIERAVNIIRIAIERKQEEKTIHTRNAGLEQQLEERTRELQTTADTLADFKAALDEHAIVAVTDSQGKITYANDKFCAISKYPREDLLGQDHRIINSGHHSKSFFRELWQTVASGQVWKGEIKNHAKDGSIYWVKSTIIPFLGYAGKPAQFIAIRTDITERKRTEESLRVSGERLRLATDAADIAVWDRDLKSEVLTWDRQMFTIYGLPPTEDGQMTHENWQATVLPADLAEQEARLGNTIAAGGRGRREFRIVRATDQAVRVIQAVETVVAGADGQAARLVGINLDITERKQAEQEINKLNAALQSRASDLEAANKELESFSYSVSHDLRAPLRAVDGFSRMVLEDYSARLDANGQRMLGVVRSEAQRMGQLIDDLLAFSRLGRHPLEPSEIDMQLLAQDVFTELAAQAPERALRLNLHPLPPAFGTQALIRQAWVNLISNAIKFTKEREIGEIEIGSRKNEDADLIYYVKDNGAGFDMNSADKLFGVFQRLHSQQEFAGTGVGLALVQRIVKRHGGRIWPDAEVNKGATFYFTLANQNL
jgi:PAS domain S-box-containing protein